METKGKIKKKIKEALILRKGITFAFMGILFHSYY